MQSIYNVNNLIKYFNSKLNKNNGKVVFQDYIENKNKIIFNDILIDNVLSNLKLLLEDSFQIKKDLIKSNDNDENLKRLSIINEEIDIVLSILLKEGILEKNISIIDNLDEKYKIIFNEYLESFLLNSFSSININKDNNNEVENIQNKLLTFQKIIDIYFQNDNIDLEHFKLKLLMQEFDFYYNNIYKGTNYKDEMKNLLNQFYNIYINKYDNITFQEIKEEFIEFEDISREQYLEVQIEIKIIEELLNDLKILNKDDFKQLHNILFFYKQQNLEKTPDNFLNNKNIQNLIKLNSLDDKIDFLSKLETKFNDINNYYTDPLDLYYETEEEITQISNIYTMFLNSLIDDKDLNIDLFTNPKFKFALKHLKPVQKDFLFDNIIKNDKNLKETINELIDQEQDFFDIMNRIESIQTKNYFYFDNEENKMYLKIITVYMNNYMKKLKKNENKDKINIDNYMLLLEEFEKFTPLSKLDILNNQLDNIIKLSKNNKDILLKYEYTLSSNQKFQKVFIESFNDIDNLTLKQLEYLNNFDFTKNTSSFAFFNHSNNEMIIKENFEKKIYLIKEKVRKSKNFQKLENKFDIHESKFIIDDKLSKKIERNNSLKIKDIMKIIDKNILSNYSDDEIYDIKEVHYELSKLSLLSVDQIIKYSRIHNDTNLTISLSTVLKLIESYNKEDLSNDELNKIYNEFINEFPLYLDIVDYNINDIKNLNNFLKKSNNNLFKKLFNNNFFAEQYKFSFYFEFKKILQNDKLSNFEFKDKINELFDVYFQNNINIKQIEKLFGKEFISEFYTILNLTKKHNDISKDKKNIIDKTLINNFFEFNENNLLIGDNSPDNEYFVNNIYKDLMKNNYLLYESKTTFILDKYKKLSTVEKISFLNEKFTNSYVDGVDLAKDFLLSINENEDYYIEDIINIIEKNPQDLNKNVLNYIIINYMKGFQNKMMNDYSGINQDVDTISKHLNKITKLSDSFITDLLIDFPQIINEELSDMDYQVDYKQIVELYINLFNYDDNFQLPDSFLKLLENDTIFFNFIDGLENNNSNSLLQNNELKKIFIDNIIKSISEEKLSLIDRIKKDKIIVVALSNNILSIQELFDIYNKNIHESKKDNILKEIKSIYGKVNIDHNSLNDLLYFQKIKNKDKDGDLFISFINDTIIDNNLFEMNYLISFIKESNNLKEYYNEETIEFINNFDGLLTSQSNNMIDEIIQDSIDNEQDLLHIINDLDLNLTYSSNEYKIKLIEIVNKIYQKNGFDNNQLYTYIALSNKLFYSELKNEDNFLSFKLNKDLNMLDVSSIIDFNNLESSDSELRNKEVLKLITNNIITFDNNDQDIKYFIEKIMLYNKDSQDLMNDVLSNSFFKQFNEKFNIYDISLKDLNEKISKTTNIEEKKLLLENGYRIIFFNKSTKSSELSKFKYIKSLDFGNTKEEKINNLKEFIKVHFENNDILSLFRFTNSNYIDNIMIEHLKDLNIFDEFKIVLQEYAIELFNNKDFSNHQKLHKITNSFNDSTFEENDIIIKRTLQQIKKDNSGISFLINKSIKEENIDKFQVQQTLTFNYMKHSYIKHISKLYLNDNISFYMMDKDEKLNKIYNDLIVSNNEKKYSESKNEDIVKLNEMKDEIIKLETQINLLDENLHENYQDNKRLIYLKQQVNLLTGSLDRIYTSWYNSINIKLLIFENSFIEKLDKKTINLDVDNINLIKELSFDDDFDNEVFEKQLNIFNKKQQDITFDDFLSLLEISKDPLYLYSIFIGKDTNSKTIPELIFNKNLTIEEQYENMKNFNIKKFNKMYKLFSTNIEINPKYDDEKILVEKLIYNLVSKTMEEQKSKGFSSSVLDLNINNKIQNIINLIKNSNMSLNQMHLINFDKILNSKLDFNDFLILFKRIEKQFINKNDVKNSDILNFNFIFTNIDYLLDYVEYEDNINFILDLRIPDIINKINEKSINIDDDNVKHSIIYANKCSSLDDSKETQITSTDEMIEFYEDYLYVRDDLKKEYDLSKVKVLPIKELKKVQNDDGGYVWKLIEMIPPFDDRVYIQGVATNSCLIYDNVAGNLLTDLYQQENLYKYSTYIESEEFPSLKKRFSQNEIDEIMESFQEKIKQHNQNILNNDFDFDLYQEITDFTYEYLGMNLAASGFNLDKQATLDNIESSKVEYIIDQETGKEVRVSKTSNDTVDNLVKFYSNNILLNSMINTFQNLNDFTNSENNEFNYSILDNNIYYTTLGKRYTNPKLFEKFKEPSIDEMNVLIENKVSKQGYEIYTDALKELQIIIKENPVYTIDNNQKLLNFIDNLLDGKINLKEISYLYEIFNNFAIKDNSSSIVNNYENLINNLEKYGNLDNDILIVNNKDKSKVFDVIINDLIKIKNNNIIDKKQGFELYKKINIKVEKDIDVKIKKDNKLSN